MSGHEHMHDTIIRAFNEACVYVCHVCCEVSQRDDPDGIVPKGSLRVVGRHPRTYAAVIKIFPPDNAPDVKEITEMGLVLRQKIQQIEDVELQKWLKDSPPGVIFEPRGIFKIEEDE